MSTVWTIQAGIIFRGSGLKNKIKTMSAFDKWFCCSRTTPHHAPIEKKNIDIFRNLVYFLLNFANFFLVQLRGLANGRRMVR